MRKRVYDPVLRIIHTWNALLVTGLLISAELSQRWFDAALTETLHRLHVWLGLGLILGVVARLTWGIVGPKHARLTDLYHPAVWRRVLVTRQWFTQPTRFGHHPEASLVYIVLYCTLLAMSGSGLVLAALEQNTGPLISWLSYGGTYPLLVKKVHLLLENVIILYLVAHLGALVMHRIRHRIPVAQSMVSGYQYRRGKK